MNEINAIMQSIIDEVKNKTIDENEQIDIVNKVFDKALPTIVEDLMITLENTSHLMLTENRYCDDEFCARLNKKWFEAFDLLEQTAVVSYEVGENIVNNSKMFLNTSNSYLFEILLHLHARAIQISKEILILMKNGYADGAIARWRTLYEISIISLFISKYGNETAKMYKDYTIVETYNELTTYIKKNDKLGYNEIPDEEIQRQEKNISELELKYGKDYIKPYGWTMNILEKKNRKFEGIENAVEQDHIRPFYKWACNAVHAGPKAAYYKIGIYGNKNIMLTGPTNYGFAGPGQNTALSLVQITSTLVLNFMDYDNLVSMNVLT